MSTERREALLVIPETTVLKLSGVDVPEGSEIMGVYYSYASRSFQMVLRHPSFDIVPMGQEAPVIKS